MTERERLKELIDQARQNFSASGFIADHLLSNGVMLVDTDVVCLVTNREPIRTAFGMPLDELAELIRAKQDGRIIVPPCKVGDTVWCIVDKVFDEPLEAKIYSITVQGGEIIMRCGVKGYYGVSYMATDFGKKFFKAKEEAEKALERSRG